MGINTIALVTTNDRFVNAQWQKSMEECMGIPEGSAPVVMLSDARGDLSEALGLIGYLGRALGVRSKRFALVIDNGIVQYKAVDGMRRLRLLSRSLAHYNTCHLRSLTLSLSARARSQRVPTISM